MKVNTKIIIFISIFCTLIGALLIYLYHGIDLDLRHRVKRTDLYNKEYFSSLDSCKKWKGTFPSLPNPYILINKDTNFIYLAILLEKYKTLDYRFIRDDLFCDICGDSIWTLINASDDAEEDYLKERYGKSFKLITRKQATDLNKKYRINYYDKVLENISEKMYKRQMDKDSIEIGILNMNYLDSLPFIVKIDTSFNSDYYRFNEKKGILKFTATQRSYEDSSKFLLPSIAVLFYFDSLKTDFPYCKYPFKRVFLRQKYKYLGLEKGTVNTDLIK